MFNTLNIIAFSSPYLVTAVVIPFWVVLVPLSLIGLIISGETPKKYQIIILLAIANGLMLAPLISIPEYIYNLWFFLLVPLQLLLWAHYSKHQLEGGKEEKRIRVVKLIYVSMAILSVASSVVLAYLGYLLMNE